MTTRSCMGFLAAFLMAPAAVAQTGGTPVETAPVPLPPEKQVIVRQHAQREKLPEAQPGVPITVGAEISEDVELWSLPQDTVTDVPSVTRYKFFRAGNTIAVVDPENRKIIQVIAK